MKSIISGVFYGLLTFMICSAVYAFISSLYYYFFNPTIVHEPKITTYISFIIITISTLIAILKARQHLLITGLTFFFLFIIVQLSLSKGSFMHYVLTEYMQILWLLIAALSGTIIGAILHTFRHQNK